MSSAADKREIDVIIEMMEIYINSILYKRKLYPEAIFRIRKAYNIPVYISIYSALNNYIAQTLKAARELIKTRKMRRLEVIIFKEQETPLESYVFDLNYNGVASALENDENLSAFEEELRKSLLSLDARMKDLKKLGESADIKFKIMLHTTKLAYVKIGNDARLQSFPFVEEKPVHGADEMSKIELLPVLQTSCVGVNVFVEEYSAA
ncbi:mitotic spindle assembly checkpoint protein MAD2B [Anopheles stephensi]|uniref:HORMA domain-containing protein n=1 Tax=Anopheles stephensi TaxID=30069 RepID=A0A182YBC4_ANOST|nr:mitotic spindle assembly checkpoint protein MAD2B [Anopheles stephensi]